ncbi:MAG: hypothetical protein Q8L22_03835 [Reyranella sp.]|nr:hypothetical protein [Reyranella sp.]
MREYAVFTEFSPDSKLMTPDWNRRAFTDTDVRKGGAIQYDFATEIVTLAPGSYHITGLSMVVYDSGGEPPEMTTIRAPASAGYCRLRTFDSTGVVDSPNLREFDNSDPTVICIGSPSTPQSWAESVRRLLRNRKDSTDTLETSIGVEAGPNLPARVRPKFQMACIRPDQHPRTLSE